MSVSGKSPYIGKLLSQKTLIYDALSWKLIGSLFGITLLMYGVNLAPTIDRIMAISKDPFTAQDTNDFLVNSPLIPILISPFELESKFVFGVFAAVISSVAVSTSLLVCWRHCGTATTKIISICFVLSPALVSSAGWIGMYDPITVAVVIVWMIQPSPALLMLSGFVIGFNHFEQGAVLLLIISLGNYFGLQLPDSAHRISRPETPKTAFVWKAIGLSAGYAVLMAYHSRTGTPVSRLQYIDDAGFERYFGNFVQHGFFIPLTGLGFLLLPVIVAMFKFPRRQMVGVVLTASIATCAAFVTLDSTRVIAILVFPVTIWATSFVARSYRNLPFERKQLLILLAIALSWPRIIIWDGRITLGAW